MFPWTCPFWGCTIPDFQVPGTTSPKWSQSLVRFRALWEPSSPSLATDLLLAAAHHKSASQPGDCFQPQPPNMTKTINKRTLHNIFYWHLIGDIGDISSQLITNTYKIIQVHYNTMKSLQHCFSWLSGRPKILALGVLRIAALGPGAPRQGLAMRAETCLSGYEHGKRTGKIK